MALKIYYHGTTADNLESILKNGLQPVPYSKRLWADSYPSLVYMWDDEKTEGTGFSMAVDAGSCGIPFAKDKRIVVFQIRCSDKYVEEDSSGINMGSLGAVQTTGVSKGYIQQYWISEDLSLISPFILKDLISGVFSGLTKELSKLEQHIVKYTPDRHCMYIGDMPINWTNIQLKSHDRQNTHNTNLIRA